MKLNPTNVRLLVINGVLLVAVLAITFWPTTATGQPGPGRIRGEYTMVSSKTIMGNADAIYVLDSANRELVAMRWDQGRRSLVGIGYRNLDADTVIAPAR